MRRESARAIDALRTAQRASLAAFLIGLMLAPAFAQKAATAPPPGQAPIDWDSIYEQKKGTQLTDFCKSPETSKAPLCEYQSTKCTGFKVEDCQKTISANPILVFIKNILSGNDLGTAVTAISGAISALLVAAVLWLKARLQKYTEFLKDETDRIERSNPELEKKNDINLVLIGLGGAGKTSIIRSISAMSKADPAIATRSNAPLYCISSEVSIVRNGKKKRRRITINIQDYRGQFVVDVLKSSLSSSRGNPTVICLVIDLFPPVLAIEEQHRAAFPDNARLNAQIGAFNIQLLEILEDTFRDGLCGFVIFVNKIDLLDLPPSAAEAAALAAVKPLQRLVSSGFQSYPPVNVIFGSATTGQGVSGFDHRVNEPRTLLETVIDLQKKYEDRS